MFVSAVTLRMCVILLSNSSAERDTDAYDKPCDVSAVPSFTGFVSALMATARDEPNASGCKFDVEIYSSQLFLGLCWGFYLSC